MRAGGRARMRARPHACARTRGHFSEKCATPSVTRRELPKTAAQTVVPPCAGQCVNRSVTRSGQGFRGWHRKIGDLCRGCAGGRCIGLAMDGRPKGPDPGLASPGRAMLSRYRPSLLARLGLGSPLRPGAFGGGPPAAGASSPRVDTRIPYAHSGAASLYRGSLVNKQSPRVHRSGALSSRNAGIRHTTAFVYHPWPTMPPPGHLAGPPSPFLPWSPVYALILRCRPANTPLWEFP